MPSSTSKRKGMRQNHHPWLANFNRCLWHIHRSSSILFLCLVLLNGLAGVLSSIERNKLAEELRKKVVTNLTKFSKEEELTRQILALFDYDGEETENTIINKTTTIQEGNSTKMNKLELTNNNNSSMAKLEMEFSVDLATNNVQNGIIFTNLTMNAENGTMGEMEMTISAPNNIPEQTTSINGILETIERINNNTNIELNQNETMMMVENNNSTMNYFGNETTIIDNNIQTMTEINTTSTIIIQQIENGTTINDQQVKEKITSTMINTQIVVEIDGNSMNKSMENEGTESTTTSTITTKAIVGKEMNESESESEQKIEEINNNLVKDESVSNNGGMKEEENAMKTAIEQIKQKGGELNEIEVGQLREYREHLKRILANVENILTNKEEPTPIQIFIAISSSLPNWESALLMNRKNALSASVDAHQIRKSPPHTTNSQIATAKRAEGMPQSTTTTTLSQSTIIGHNEGDIEMTAMAMGQKIGTNAPENAAEGEKMQPAVSDDSNESSNEQWNPRKNGFIRAESIASNSLPFSPTRNNSLEYCKHLSQTELVNELKQKGTYNPELMAWDVSGVFRFLDRSIVDQYERQSKPPKSSEQAVRRNVEALEQLLGELNLQCEVRTPEVISRLNNLTLTEPRRSIISPSLRSQVKIELEKGILNNLNEFEKEEIRHKRNIILADQLVQSFNSSLRRDSPLDERQNGKTKTRKQKLIGDVHVVPFGCDKRGYSEDGYLRLCGACQAIRKLPDEFFPPFINEVMCDEDKACLYFYDYPHGKCKQKHMNFVVLRNVGTQLCQVWEKFNLNVRVSCECFVDEMSFFAKYV